MNWILAIDYGTTNTSAAAKNRRGTHVLDLAGRRQYPSCVHIGARGEILTGADAENVAVLFVDRFVATPKRRLAERTLVIGGAEVPVVDLVAATLRAVYQEAVRSCGSSPAGVVLTHPARWNPGQIGVLRAAAAAAGMHDVTVVAEPVAAARAFVGSFDVRQGAPFALFDLGGGTLDVAIVEHVGDELRQIAAPGGVDPLGGEDFDGALTQHVLGSARLPAAVTARLRDPRDLAARRERRELHHAVRAAKEALSTHESAYVVVPGVEQPLVVTRAEFDECIRRPVGEAVDELVRALERSRLAPNDLDAVFLAGGSCRIPLVANEIRRRLPGVRVETVGNPKTVTAEGAALLAALPAEAAPSRPPTAITLTERRKRRRGSRRPLGAAAAAVAVGGLVWAGFTVGADEGGQDVTPLPTPVVNTIETDPSPGPETTRPERTDPEPTVPEPTDPEPTVPEPTVPEPTDPESTAPDPTLDEDVARLHGRFPLMADVECTWGDPILGLEAYAEQCELVETSTGSTVWFIGHIVEDGYDTYSYLDELSGRGELTWVDAGTWSWLGEARGPYMDFDWLLDDGSSLACRAWGDDGSDLVGWACSFDAFAVQPLWTEIAG